MILKSLTATNFRKFKHVEIDFPDGVVGIFGLNGVGKSTLFEAVAWALYGPVAARTSADRIKRDGASPSESCRVTVEFLFNENTYKVTREMTGKTLSSSAVVTMNGKIAAQGAEATTKFIQKLFGMDAKSFFTSLFAKQKELNTLSTMYASERKQLILRMLGIDALDKAIKNVRSDIRKTRELIEHYNVSLKDELTGRLKKEIYREQIIEREKKIKEVDSVLHEKKKRLTFIEKKLKAADENKRLTQKKYEEMQRKLEEIRKTKELHERRKRLEKEIEKLNESIKNRETLLKVKEEEAAKYRGAKEELEEVEKSVEELKQKITNVIREIQKEETRIENLGRERRRIESRKENIVSIGPSAPCPTCGRVLGDHYQKLIDKFEKEILENEEEKRRIERSMSGYKKEKNRLEKLEEALLRKRRYLMDLKIKEEKLKAVIQSITRELNREKMELEQKEEELSTLRVVTFDENLYRETEENVRRYYIEYKNRVEEVEKKQRELHAALEELNKVEGEQKLFKQQVKELKERIMEQEEMEGRIEKEKTHLSHLNLLEDVMTSFRTNMISRIRPTLSTYASSLLESLTDGKYSEMELNENYDIVIYDSGVPYEIERFSGGEEDLANLCIRLAISEMLTERAGGEFNLVILDEVFGSQDANRRRNILSALNLLSNKFRQIFLITHIEDVKQFVTNAILVYETEDGTSRVKIE